MVVCMAIDAHHDPPSPLGGPGNAGDFAELGSLGRYTLVERLAVGADAEVMIAEEPRAVGAPRRVIIKRLLAHGYEDDAEANPLALEWTLLKQLNHPNIVSLLDQHEGERGLEYMVLEYVPGVDLWRLLRWLRKHNKQMNFNLALHIGAGLLNGLHALHQAQDAKRKPLHAVHCDVSPSNVLLSVYGDTKLSDFGSSQTDASLQASKKHKPTGVGKVNYVSPESLSNTRVDHRSDLFSAAAVIAEMLLGDPLFVGPSELSILLAIRDADISALLQHGRGWPPGLASVLARALNKNPDERFENAAEFAENLRVLCSESEVRCKELLSTLVEEALKGREMPSMQFNLPSAMATVPPEGKAVTAPPAAGSPYSEKTDTAPPAFAATPNESAVKEITSKVPAFEFTVFSADGSTAGQYTYAQLVEGIATGRIDLEDNIQMYEGGPMQRIREVPELSRHLPLVTQALRLSDPPPTAIDTPSQTVPISVVAHAALTRYSGLIFFSHGEIHKEVYFKRGVPEFVRSNLASDLLGEYLLSCGAINRGELDMALAVMHKFDGQLGETLLALGLLDSLRLFKHIQNQVRNRLLDLLQWTNAEIQYIRDAQSPQGGFPVSVDPWEIMLEALVLRFQNEQDRAPKDTQHVIAKGRFASDDLLRLPEAPGSLYAMIQNTDKTWADLQTKFRKRTGHKSQAWKPEYALALLMHLEMVEIA